MTWHFSDRAIKVKSQKNYKDAYVAYFPVCSPKVCAVCMYSTALVFEENLRKLLWQLWAALLQGCVNFTPLLLISDKPGCAIFQAHTYRARNYKSRRQSCRAEACFRSCEVRCSRAEYILFPCCSYLTNQGVRYSRRIWVRLLILKETFMQAVFADVNCAVVGLSVFHSLL